MPSPTRTGRLAALVLTTAALAAAPLLAAAPTAAAEPGHACLTVSTTQLGVKAGNRCLQDTIRVSINIWGPDPACRLVHGPLVPGQPSGGTSIGWSNEWLDYWGGSAADVYECA